MTVDVQFRGETRTVVVDDVEEDESVNFYAVEWHFDGVAPAEHDALEITAAEEDAIVQQLWQALWDHRASDD